jgi:ABC-2 type transport system ATP-binding protein
MIRVEALTKEYGPRKAIENLTFDAQKGEIVGFLGPNGAGKTTTMRILAGYMPPTSGIAEVAGFDVVEQSLEVRRRMGYLPETVPLYTDMTVYEYLKYMGDLRNVPELDERIDEVLEEVNMVERADGYIAKLSKGMRQRVGLAQALLHQPEVLILDEPTIGLDPAQIIEVRKLIRAIGRERTVLLSTHILSEVQQLCDRVLIINRGKIVAEDTPAQLQARLTGVQKVILQVAGDADGLADVVQNVPGVQRVLVEAEGNLTFEAQPGQDVRPDVAKAVVNGGYSLIELRPVGLSLEAIFMELTREDPELPQVDESSPEDELDDDAPVNKDDEKQSREE